MADFQSSTDVFMIRALPPPSAAESLASFFGTAKGEWSIDQITVVDELGSREATLNAILARRNRDRDLFVFVDDIRFTPHWLEDLSPARNFGDVVGFSMVDPQTGRLQDFGYDFVEIDGVLTYRGLFKHSRPEDVQCLGYRECASVCG